MSTKGIKNKILISIAYNYFREFNMTYLDDEQVGLAVTNKKDLFVLKYKELIDKYPGCFYTKENTHSIVTLEEMLIGFSEDCDISFLTALFRIHGDF